MEIVRVDSENIQPKRRVSKKKKRWINFLSMYLIFVFFVLSNFTLSRYSGKIEATTTLKVAKFTAKVNQEDVVEKKEFTLNLSQNSSSLNNKMTPDSEGYFDIEINPEGAQVSLDFELIFDMTELQNTKVDLKKYTIDYTENYTNNTQMNVLEIPENNIITGEIILDETDIDGFTADDKITVRVFWQWNEDIYVTKNSIQNITDKNIKTTCIIRQKISD